MSNSLKDVPYIFTRDRYSAPIHGANVGGAGNHNLVNNMDDQADWKSKLEVLKHQIEGMETESEILGAQFQVSKAGEYRDELDKLIDDLRPKLEHKKEDIASTKKSRR